VVIDDCQDIRFPVFIVSYFQSQRCIGATQSAILVLTVALRLVAVPDAAAEHDHELAVVVAADVGHQ